MLWTRTEVSKLGITRAHSGAQSRNVIRLVSHGVR